MSDSPDTARLLNRTLVPPTYLLHKLTYCVNWIISSFPVIGSFGMNSAKTIQFEGNDATKDDHDALKWFKKGAGGGNAFYIASLGYLYQEDRGVVFHRLKRDWAPCIYKVRELRKIELKQSGEKRDPGL